MWLGIGEAPVLRGRGLLLDQETIFRSTLPVWGATGMTMPSVRSLLFQSTLPVWGATSGGRRRSWPRQNFNPRSPCWERLRSLLPFMPLLNFNPRSPCGERQQICTNTSLQTYKLQTKFSPSAKKMSNMSFVILWKRVLFWCEPPGQCVIAASSHHHRISGPSGR